MFREAANDLAVVIDQERRRRGLGIYDFGRLFGMSDSRIAALSRYLRGEDSNFGYLAATRLAQRLNIPMVMLVGEEARNPPSSYSPPPQTPVALKRQPRQTRRLPAPTGQLMLEFAA